MNNKLPKSWKKIVKKELQPLVENKMLSQENSDLFLKLMNAVVEREIFIERERIYTAIRLRKEVEDDYVACYTNDDLYRAIYPKGR